MRHVAYQRFSLRAHTRRSPRPQLRVCQFALTFSCALRCRHCYCACFNRPDYRSRELKLVKVNAVLRRLREAGCLWICFTGGDPLIRPDFLDIYARARELGFIVTVFTSGYVLPASVLSFFRKAPPFVVELTLNAAQPGIFERISGIPGSFQRVMSTVDRLRGAGIRLKIKTQVTRDNLRHLPQLRSFLRARGLSFNPGYDLYARLDHDTAPCSLRVDPREVVNGQPAELIAEARRSCAALAGKQRGASRRLFRCAAADPDGLYIDPRGRMTVCDLLGHPWRDALRDDILGSLGWLSRHAARQCFLSRSPCRSCRKRPFCYNCPGRAFVETGDREAPVPYYCRLADAFVKKIGVCLNEK